MRRLISASLIVLLTVLGAGPAVVGQTPTPSPSPTVANDLDTAFPSAEEVAEALGTDVEAGDIVTDMSQLWEGAGISAMDVPAARMQTYRSLPGETDSMLAGGIVEIVRFADSDDAAAHSEGIAAAFSDSLMGFETDLSADLVATQSWTSDDGISGSTVMAREGPLVVMVTLAGTAPVEMETASEALAKLVLGRLADG